VIRLFPLALLLGACAASPSPRPIGSNDHVCKADGLGELVGKPGSSELAAQALRLSGAATLRWIQPGMAVTMDFRQDRLDLHLDDKNNVTRITCG
jgi:hypothetical protein